MKAISIGKRLVGAETPPFLVAEISANHNQSFERAAALVQAAKAAGADAVKLQTYTAETLTMDSNNPEFLIQDSDSLWHGKRLYDLYSQAYTPWEWHKPLQELCQKEGLIFFSTPFDETAVEFLAELSVPCFKIASHEITHLPLIRKAASYHKPLILSTGMATLDEIGTAVETAQAGGCEEIILLKCTSEYPASSKNSHLRTLQNLTEVFDLPVGLSDHTLGVGAALASVALGGCMLEKHLTLSRKEGGVDAAFSMEPDEFKLLAIEAKEVWQSLGHVHYGPLPEEKTSYSHRRSIYFNKDLQPGDRLTAENIKIIRPSNGLSPSEYDKILGRQVAKEVKRGMPVSWDLLK